MMRHILPLILFIISLEQVTLACGFIFGAEDTTSETMGIAMGIFLFGLLLAAAHLIVFIYRKGQNGWVFWITFALSLIISPISLFLMMMAAGTACGEGSIQMALFTLAFQLSALAAQLFSWKFSGRSYSLNISGD